MLKASLGAKALSLTLIITNSLSRVYVYRCACTCRCHEKRLWLSQCILVLCLMRILISGLTLAMFATFLLSHPRPAQNQKTFEPGSSQVPGVCSCVQSAWLLQLPDAWYCSYRDMFKLQRVQNCLARLVARAGCFAPNIPLCHSLRWLHISFRIQFKILTLNLQDPLFW